MPREPGRLGVKRKSLLQGPGHKAPLQILLIKAVLDYSSESLQPCPPNISPQTLVPFHNLGLLVGLFAPRCADTWTTTRQEAVGCVYSLLYLQLGYEGEPCWGCGDRGGSSWMWGQSGIPEEGFSQLRPLRLLPRPSR